MVPSYTDYGGVILDPRGDGKTAQMFLANARGIQYDAISSDATGEDSSPDFYWESAGRVVEGGWRLEMRIPFSSIRYVDPNPDHWGILLYRNQPRDYRYQYFSSRLPRERNCFICNVRDLTGMNGAAARRPLGGGALRDRRPELERAVDGPGSRLETGSAEFDGGADFKWLPNPDTVIDATINPDFSQIELDSAQISANERFALFLPEKRPFFLESVDLFSTPIQAVYTRTFSSPRWGARATGGSEKTKYTLLVGEDRGGGSVILPGAESSDLVRPGLRLVGRDRPRPPRGRQLVRELPLLRPRARRRRLQPRGRSRLRVAPDRAGHGHGAAALERERDAATAPTSRPSGTAARSPATPPSSGGTAPTGDLGLLPARHATSATSSAPTTASCRRSATGGPTARSAAPSGRRTAPVRRIRLFGFGEYNADQEGRLLSARLAAGFGLDAPLNSFVRVELGADDVRSAPRSSAATRCGRRSRSSRGGSSRASIWRRTSATRSTSPTHARRPAARSSSRATCARPTTSSSRSAPPGAGSTSTPGGAARRAC